MSFHYGYHDFPLDAAGCPVCAEIAVEMGEQRVVAVLEAQDVVGLTKARHFEGRPFLRDEHASSATVADVTPELLIDDPALQGKRSIECECGCPDLGEHNAAVTRRRLRP